jgi:hypothetical protein
MKGSVLNLPALVVAGSRMGDERNKIEKLKTSPA